MYAGIDDSGIEATGDHRWFVGANWGNPLKQDDIFSYQFTASLENIDFLRAHSASYTIPFEWRHTGTIFASYADAKPNLNTPGLDYNLSSWQTGARYSMPIATPGHVEWFQHNLDLGFDYKETNAAFGLGGTVLPVNRTSVFQFTTKYGGTIKDKLGKTNYGLQGYFSPGDAIGRNSDADYKAVDPRADSTYVYAQFNLDRTTRLPYGFNFVNNFIYQVSSKKLLSSEQLGVGGYATVRGYEEYETTGDEGFVLRNEIQTPSINLAGNGDLMLLSFFDCGRVTNVGEKLPGEEAHYDLASVGLGARYNFNEYVSARFDYGFQLEDTGFNQRNNSRGHFGLIVGF
jgi:hemolysin activation/secretion protein